MKLSQQLAKSIRSGTILVGTLTGLSGGRGTVQLSSGQQLTNIHITDTTANIGDTVIIDYSAGVPPTIRISDKQDNAVTAAALETGEERPEELVTRIATISRPDISCLVSRLTPNVDEYDDAYWLAKHGQETLVQWGVNFNSTFEENSVLWDSANIYHGLSMFEGDYYLHIPQDGRYLITGAFSAEGAFWDVNGLDYEVGGYMGLQIYKNDVCIIKSKRWVEGTYYPSTTLWNGVLAEKIVSCSAGDKISLSYYIHIWPPPWFAADWGGYITSMWTENCPHLSVTKLHTST